LKVVPAIYTLPEKKETGWPQATDTSMPLRRRSDKRVVACNSSDVKSPRVVMAARPTQAA